jgi:PhnB protein
MTIPTFLFEGTSMEARRRYAAIFRARAPLRPSRDLGDSVLYAAVRTRQGWRPLPDPSQADPMAGSAFAVTMSDPAEGRRVFDALAEGGQVEAPYEPSPWSPGFGRLTDRFGACWMVDAMPAPRGGA